LERDVWEPEEEEQDPVAAWEEELRRDYIDRIRMLIGLADLERDSEEHDGEQ
jgi:hypothetical protein